MRRRFVVIKYGKINNNLEQTVGAKPVNREIAKFINAQYLGSDVVVQRPFDVAGGVRGGLLRPSPPEELHDVASRGR
ncbi:MAG: hypothetical protein NUV75_07630 [Gallionella sp.]|nr:hypothetical protein [Gallionella sp.]